MENTLRSTPAAPGARSNVDSIRAGSRAGIRHLGTNVPAETDLCEVLVSMPLDGPGEAQAGSVRTHAVTATAPTAAAAAGTNAPAGAIRAASARLTSVESNDNSALGLRLVTAGNAVLDEPPTAVDERSALLGAWQRSDETSSYGKTESKEMYTKPGVTGSPPVAILTAATATNRLIASSLMGAGEVTAAATGGVAAAATAAVAATQRRSMQSFSPFELLCPAVAGLAATGETSQGPVVAAAVAATTRAGSGCTGAARGGSGVQVERTPSTLLSATTAAGDLHTAVPPPSPGAAGVSAGSGVGGDGGGGGGASRLGPADDGGGVGGSGALPYGSSSSLVDDTAQLREYVREEQLRHAAEARSRAVGLSRAALKRVFMLAVTGGLLGAAIYLSGTPWGSHQRGGLPVWRWFLIAGCLPAVWYIPWFAIFLLVLLLESLLPVAMYGSGGGSSGVGGGFSHSRSAMAAQAAQGGVGGVGNVSGGNGGEERGSEMAGPALLIYHILGVRQHMVRVLRSLSCQLLVHYAVVDCLTPDQRSREDFLMKAWSCVTLFLTASTLKSLVAKALSKHFHSKGYLQRMQQAVKQELVLMALSRPRPGRSVGDVLSHVGLGYHLANIFGYTGLSTGVSGGGSGGTGGGGGGKEYGGSGRGVVRSPFAAAAESSVGIRVGGVGDSVTPSRLREKLLAPGKSGNEHRSVQSVPNLAALASQQLQPLQTQVQKQQQGKQENARQSSEISEVVGVQAMYGHEGGIMYGSGSGTAAAVTAAAGETSRSSGRRKAVGSGGEGARWRSAWLSLVRHLKHTYAKTKIQWDLSRPGANTHRGTNVLRGGRRGGQGRAGVVGGEGGVEPGSGAGAAAGRLGGGGGGTSSRGEGLTFEQLRTSLFWLEQHIRRNKLQMGLTLSDQLRAAAEGNEVTSKTEAKRLAFYIHMNVLGLSDLKGRKYLVARDFEPFFNSAEEVREAFAMFDSDRDSRITLQNMVDTIVRIYKERKKLALTLQDTRTVVAKLELICGVVMHVLFGFLYLVIFQVNVRELWLTFSSVTLAFVFVFGNSIRSIYEAVLFLFVVHPFDVGDWLLLANGEVVKVEEIALLFCTFLKGDGRRLYYPNPKLIQEAVVNISRSETFWDSATVLVDVSTPGSVLEAVEGRLKRWLADNPKQYTGSGGVAARALANPSKLQVTASWEYCHTGEDQGRTTRWRSKALLVLASALESCGTSYTFPAMKGVRLDREAAAVVGLMEGEAAAGLALVNALGGGGGGGGGGGNGARGAATGAVTEFGAGTAMTMQGM